MAPCAVSASVMALGWPPRTHSAAVVYLPDLTVILTWQQMLLIHSVPAQYEWAGRSAVQKVGLEHKKEEDVKPWQYLLQKDLVK